MGRETNVETSSLRNIERHVFSICQKWLKIGCNLSYIIKLVL